MNNYRPTVFVLDADSVVRDAVSSLAHTMNLHCETFASGREFLEHYDPHRPGCVVTEIRIPDVNGVQIQERLSREGSLLPIIFLTSQATVSIAVRALRNGALHVIEKPFREHELWDAIHEALELNVEQRELAERRRGIDERVSQLSDKDQVLLKMIGEGVRKEAMAKELGVSVRTIEIRRKQLMKNLGAYAPIELFQLALAATDKEPRANDLHHHFRNTTPNHSRSHNYYNRNHIP